MSYDYLSPQCKHTDPTVTMIMKKMKRKKKKLVCLVEGTA